MNGNIMGRARKTDRKFLKTGQRKPYLKVIDLITTKINKSIVHLKMKMDQLFIDNLF